jgi:hypothetical protein
MLDFVPVMLYRLSYIPDNGATKRESQMSHVKNNPHLKESIQLARESGLALGREDFRSSYEHKPYKCVCGSRSWWKPTVGAYICANRHINGRSA